MSKGSRTYQEVVLPWSQASGCSTRLLIVVAAALALRFALRLLSGMQNKSSLTISIRAQLLCAIFPTLNFRGMRMKNTNKEVTVG